MTKKLRNSSFFCAIIKNKGNVLKVSEIINENIFKDIVFLIKI